MVLLDINGRPTKVTITKKTNPIRGRMSRSDVQYRVGVKLIDILPNDDIFEEVNIPGSSMTLDFYIPSRKVAIEVDGEQHGGYNSFFHGQVGSMKYTNQVIRDTTKNNWCEVNGIRLIRVTGPEEIDNGQF